MAETKKQTQSSPPQRKHSYAKSMTILITGYVLAIIACYLSYPYVRSQTKSALIQGIALDVIATQVVFLFSLAIQNSSMYDPYWGISPLPIALFWLFTSSDPTSIKNILIVVVIAFYVVRHGFLFFRFWYGFDYEDFRYRDLKETLKGHPIVYWIGSYTAFHSIPTFMVMVGLAPACLAMGATEIDSPLIFYGGLLVTLAGVVIEAVADEQIYPFRFKSTSGQIIDEGLWRYSRHPNYFGEITVWLGLYITLLGTNGVKEWAWVGSVAMYLMFELGTIPWMEKHLLKKRPIYAMQQKRVSKLIFWFRNEKAAEEYKAKTAKGQ